MKVSGPLLIILALFTIFAVLFAHNTPYRQPGVLLYSRVPDPETGRMRPAPVIDVGAPDELQHANYVAYLLAGKGFPVLVPGSPDLGKNYQAHQPPLYYLLCAGWSKLLGAEPTSESGIKLRYLNIVIGIATLLGVASAAFWATGRETIAYGSMAFAGLMPMFIALNSAVTNDPLLFAICTWTLALLIRAVQSGWTPKLALGVGILIGCGLLTKTTAIMLVPLAGLALLFTQRQSTVETRPRPITWILALGLPFLIAAPWLARNMNLYGDPFAISAFNEAFVNSPQASAFIQADGIGKYLLNWVGWYTGRSFIGVFGYMDIFMFEKLRPDQAGAIYVALLFLMGMLLAAGIYGALGTKRGESIEETAVDPAPGAWLAITLCALTTILYLRFNLQYFQAQARYLYPAIGGVALFAGIGIHTATKGRYSYAWLILAIPLLVLDFVALSAIQQGFPLRV